MPKTIQFSRKASTAQSDLPRYHSLKLTFFTDGSYARIKSRLELLFGTKLQDRESIATAGIVMYMKNKVNYILRVPNIDHRLVEGVKTYITEAVAIIAALHHYKGAARGTACYLDCQSLVQAISSYSELQSRGRNV